MAHLPPIVPLLVGLVALLAGAEILVRNASKLAGIFGISPLMVGLTVVALGTSAPELAISVSSVLGGESGLALGNVLGSNILNILLILGSASLIRPLRVSRQLIRLDVPIMVGVSVAVFLLASDGGISRSDGLLLVFGAMVYVVLLFRNSAIHRRERLEMVALDPTPQSESPSEGRTGVIANWVLPSGSTWRKALILVLRAAFVLLGIVLLVQGARWMVAGAVTVAVMFGLSPLVVGLTILATGTSLPELATSCNASLRGQGDIAVGNVVGSNLLNLLVVLGVAAMVAPAGIPVPRPAIAFDLPVMVGVAIACLPIFFTGSRISRSEGALFLFYYVAYMAYLILKGSREGDSLARLLEVAMVGYVLPLTFLTLIGVMVRERTIRRARQRRFQARNRAGVGRPPPRA